MEKKPVWKYVQYILTVLALGVGIYGYFVMKNLKVTWAAATILALEEFLIKVREYTQGEEVSMLQLIGLGLMVVGGIVLAATA